MAPKTPKPAAKKPAAKAKEPAAKEKRAPKGELVRAPTRKSAKGAAANEAPTAAPAAAPERKGASIPPGPEAASERILFPKDVYEGAKDAIKAPLKRHGFQWQYLGEGKGRYHRDHAFVFVQFTDAGTDYHVRAKDPAFLRELVEEWRSVVGAEVVAAAKEGAQEAAAAEAAAAESEAVKLWKLGEPQRRPGEPESFFTRRREEWLARRPA